MLLPIDELNTLKVEISEIVRTVQSEADNYDSIDFLIDLLASTVIPLVEDHLTGEYDEAFRIGIDGWLDTKPDAAARHEAVYADVGGENFADRIERYATEGFDGFVTKVAVLLETDGHRVRSEGTLAAGNELTSVGLRVVKTWKTMLDQKVRDPHVELEGVTIPYDEMFEIDGYKALAPGLFHEPSLDVNCRCELELSVIE